MDFSYGDAVFVNIFCGVAVFSEIKVQKTLAVMFVRDQNLASYVGETYCV